MIQYHLPDHIYTIHDFEHDYIFSLIFIWKFLENLQSFILHL